MRRFFRKKNDKIQELIQEIRTLATLIDGISDRVESLERSTTEETKEGDDKNPTFEKIRSDWLKGVEEE
ncbi:MAG: hypothetical protein IJ033_03820 [Clostridia bacterium]|nr:hypothetical protein [Clostridia bacterium]